MVEFEGQNILLATKLDDANSPKKMKYLIIFSLILFPLGCNAKYPSEYVLEEKELVPEGIAYSVKTDAFYLTSVAKSKIIAVDRKSGRQTNFINEGEFGYSPGAGIYVDDERGHLHAIGGYYTMQDSLSSLYTFDINTRKLLQRYSLTGEHFLNDMVMDKKGNIYLTDSKDASVYILKHGSDSLEVFYQSAEIEFPNGIAISNDNSKLYIASIPKGVRIMDIASKNILNEQDSLGISQGIDGLEFYKGHLYGIQNSKAGNPFNFRKLILNKTGDAIVEAEIIDADTPNLDVPLTFCFADNQAVVIGNSNLQHLNQETYTFDDPQAISNSKLLVYPIE